MLIHVCLFSSSSFIITLFLLPSRLRQIPNPAHEPKSLETAVLEQYAIVVEQSVATCSSVTEQSTKGSLTKRTYHQVLFSQPFHRVQFCFPIFPFWVYEFEGRRSAVSSRALLCAPIVAGLLQAGRGPAFIGKTTASRGQSGRKTFAGRIWPTGRGLETPCL